MWQPDGSLTVIHRQLEGNTDMKVQNKEGSVEKMMIKVTLNSKNPAEAELIRILESDKKRCIPENKDLLLDP